MKKPFLFHIFIACCVSACGQSAESYDIATFTPPKDWTRQQASNHLVYTKTNPKEGSWCQLAFYKSTTSQGGIQADFTAEWNQLVASPNQITDAPKTENARDNDGWQIQTGGTRFKFNNKEALALLTTYSGYNSCISVLIQTNKKEYMDEALASVNSIILRKPESASPLTSNFKFSTTNFDDGWTSVIQSDWVRASKGNIQVLIHYPGNITTKYYPDRLEEDKIVWNLYITPRYSNLQNFEQLKNNLSFYTVHFMAATLTDANGHQSFVALFRKGDAKNGWIEIICPDRSSFVSTFGIDKYDVYFTGWDPLAKLANLNRFAVAASDLDGKWTTNFSGMTQYVNVYTGASAGAKTYQSNQQYVFSKGSSYHWELNVVSGFVGSLAHQSTKSNGTFSMPDNWNLHLSDVEGKPKDYPIQFSAIKNGRVLWIDNQVFVKVE